jgi:hypothetical protein
MKRFKKLRQRMLKQVKQTCRALLKSHRRSKT